MRIIIKKLILLSTIAVIAWPVFIFADAPIGTTTGATSLRVEVSPICGNGTQQSGEDCDGEDLGGETCQSQGFDSGSLACKDDCTFDTSGCATEEVVGGGGGGGALLPIVKTRVILRGKASPSAYVTVLKNGQIVANTHADSLANFEIEFTNITSGVHVFGVWAQDRNGARSITFSFTINVLPRATTTVSGIFLPPTISLSRDSVKRGETLNISGMTAPQSQIEIYISPSELVKKVVADSKGSWFYNLDTNQLERGIYGVRVRASTVEGLLSIFSQSLLFGVDKVPEAVKTADLNGDGWINLIDLSILLYHWGIPKNPAVDLNDDGRVDLIDVSIMWYWWTG